MKWLLRIIGLIILLFIAICAVGFFLPSTQTIERSIEVEAYPEDVFPYLNNLQLYSQWSPLYAQLTEAEIIYGGGDAGVGQNMAWQNGSGAYPFGSQEIMQSQPGEFVQVKANLSGRDATATHALLQNDTGDSLTILTKSDIELGGFPYLERVRSKLRSGWFNDQFDAGLMRLKTISETHTSE